MPRTEWTGETDYAAQIQALTGGQVSREALLAPWPQELEGSDASVDEVEKASA